MKVASTVIAAVLWRRWPTAKPRNSKAVKTSTRVYLGFDLGASSGRAVLGTLDGRRLQIQEIARFRNEPLRFQRRLHWNILSLWSHMTDAIGQCAQHGHKTLAGIGVDTWGVDFGLIGSDGALLRNPLCYRDPITLGIEPIVRAAIDQRELYRISGCPAVRVSTLSELMAISRGGDASLASADTLLMMSDLFRYALCGHKAVELTAGSSSQLIAIRGGAWSRKLLRAVKLSKKLFPEIVQPGTVVGKLDAGLADTAGVNRAPVVAIAGHDTASAAAAVPFVDPDCAMISCGTWSVVGAIVDTPNTSAESMAAGFINEFGLNSILFVKNISGLYLFENLHRDLHRDSRAMTYPAMVRAAVAATPLQYFLDIDAPSLLAGGDSITLVRQFLRRTCQKAEIGIGETVRTIIEAIAWSYRLPVAQLAKLTGRSLRRICLVGGGSRNRLLCQMAADATGLDVIAGPAEATVIGNLACQALATGQLKSAADIRKLVQNSFVLKTYRPRATAMWDSHLRRYQEIAEKFARTGKQH